MNGSSAAVLLVLALIFSCQPLNAQGDNSQTVTTRTVTRTSSNVESSSTGGTNSANTSTVGGQTTTSETSQVVEQTGVMGFKKSNKFVPNYKKRIQTYKEQIQLGLKAGWLSPEDAQSFGQRLDELTTLESEVCAKNYVQPYIDDLDKQFTKFNMEFSNAGQKKANSAGTPSAVPSSSPVQTAVPASTNATPPQGSSSVPAKVPAGTAPITKTVSSTGKKLSTPAAARSSGPKKNAATPGRSTGSK